MHFGATLELKPNLYRVWYQGSTQKILIEGGIDLEISLTKIDLLGTGGRSPLFEVYYNYASNEAILAQADRLFNKIPNYYGELVFRNPPHDCAYLGRRKYTPEAEATCIAFKKFAVSNNAKDLLGAAIKPAPLGFLEIATLKEGLCHGSGKCFEVQWKKVRPRIVQANYEAGKPGNFISVFPGSYTIVFGNDESTAKSIEVGQTEVRINVN
jgi:hypothetical protein